MSNKSVTRLYKNGIIANDIHLIIKNWTIDYKDISMILSDDTTFFASLKSVVNTKDIQQCRKLLGLANNIDLAMICVIVMSNTFVNNDDLVTNWVASDMQESSIRISVRGKLPPELKAINTGTICAILNPDIKEQMVKTDLKCINIRQMDDILIIGELDGLQFCKGITSKGTACRNFVYTHNQGDFCKFHVKSGTKTKKVSSAVKTNVEHPNTKVGSTLTDDRYIHIYPTSIKKVNTPFTFTDSGYLNKPKETINKLGDLNILVQKVISERNNDVNKDTRSLSNNETKARSSGNITKSARSKEFERLAQMIHEHSLKGTKEYKQILGSLQLIVRRLDGVSSDVIERCEIMKSCNRLLDHPIESIAISSLKLRRAIRKHLKTPNKNLTTHRFTGSVCSGHKPTQTDTKDEEGMKIKDRLKELEKMDIAEEYKQTIKFIEVLAYYCEECDRWAEHINPYCKQENHTFIRKKVKKESHFCMNEKCRYKYYSLNGQNPTLCPKCKESTIISEKTSFYNPRPDYLLPNEILLDCEIGAHRPRDANS
ncbi:hypothetical protein BEWA_005140 [Theileria equi strain WA]|uniref:Zinc finger Mcm10/DnaG-type domain-containing protein n=1 Tax=Theileria equi strain WA TaxID=1537102 RepID=L0B1H8_THEEQ|nr:hypothetical protein BEWA_005140 [Theileria equi strain WA]AFZ81106.1 hypothetical protein BEWA_005140 [Theileria equi strain WA]|eukprot:XP_004830772.1 hypothetical protein BEWA_005140 [Theileria equi strain WA]